MDYYWPGARDGWLAGGEAVLGHVRVVAGQGGGGLQGGGGVGGGEAGQREAVAGGDGGGRGRVDGRVDGRVRGHGGHRAAGGDQGVAVGGCGRPRGVSALHHDGLCEGEPGPGAHLHVLLLLLLELGNSGQVVKSGLVQAHLSRASLNFLF